MPPANQHTAAARKVYETYWDSYLNGDLETFTFALDENYEMIGTSEGEIAHNKADGIAFFKSQMQEMAGKAEMRNRQISAKPMNGIVLINEHCDIYVLAGTEWVFYSKIRISTFLHETPSGWKVVQQHGSLSDMRVQEGETLAIDKISRENVELRDAVKRRTAELESKNRELEVEAALERVRTIAMGMKKPDDLLDVCRIISEQLELLKISNIRNVQVAIIDEPKKIYANYQYFSTYANSVFEETVYTDNKASSEMVTAMQKSANSFFIGSIKGDELHRFREWRKDHNQLPDPILDDLPEVFYYFYSIGQGGLGLTTYQAINENELEIFKRFHLVFKLAYSRFMDIQKAEAQAVRAEKDLIAIKAARQKAEEALTELKATQTQLIQQEKLASLGQLTAGIAHEIKNPLNFVNNFSEVSIEMIDEAFDELAKVKTQHAASQVEAIQVEAIQETETILNDIKSNLTKIHEHGSRADGIVKSMLMHARGGSGKMEPTDLNALIKEYVNLSFHGMRAGKNPINVDIKLDLDDSIGKIALIEEDFSRVLLNLCNNAFDAMRETALARPPRLIVRTKLDLKHVLIENEDNGPGIPDNIKDKILQPFFTTKKGTEGTGLGLSITHDIVKAHGGELKVETKTARAGSDGEGEGSTFIILIPIKNNES